MRPPTRRRRRPALVGLAVLAVVAATVATGWPAASPAPSGTSASPSPSQPPSSTSSDPAPVGAAASVATSLVDVALLPRAGSDGAPRLLTVGHDGATLGRAVLTVLERTGGRWSPRAGTDHRPPTLARMATPWLVAIDERRFVLISVAPEAAVTWLAAVTWTGEELRIGPVASVGGMADAAMAADAFGDGSRDLVLIESRTRRGGGTCQGSRLTVVDASTLRVEADHGVPNLRLAAGAASDLDAIAGADLVATAYTNCPAGPATPNRLRIVAVRLVDGRVIADQRVEPADPLVSWSGRPAIVDVDRDGREEVLVGSAPSLVAFDPHRGWDATQVGGAPGILLGASGRSDTNGVTVATMAEDAVRVSRLQRDRDGWTVATTLRVDEAAAGAPRWGAATLDVRATAIRSGGSGWLLDGPACPSLVAPLVVAPCDTTVPASAGPAWAATRPIAMLPDGAVLVVQTDEWRGPGMRLVPPSPIAVEPADAAWRQGPSERFSVVEVASPLDGPIAADPRLDGFAAGSPPTVGVSGVPGTRIVTATHAGAVSSGAGGGSLAGLLASLPRDDATLDLVRIPDSGTLQLDLPARSEGAPAAWTVELAGIGPLGDVSVVTGSTIELDVAAPPVALDEAFIRPPWPLAAHLTGRTEPGATVSDGSREAVAGPDGRFSLEARLAPWPQRVTVRAADPAGNVATASADIVGGLDLRELPWIPIVVVGIVAGAAVGGLRARRPAATPAPDEETPAVEELQPRRLQ